MHYIAIKITQITVFYMTIFAPTCHIKDCYLCNFNRNIVHLLVLLNKYVKNARCNNQSSTQNITMSLKFNSKLHFDNQHFVLIIKMSITGTEEDCLLEFRSPCQTVWHLTLYLRLTTNSPYDQVFRTHPVHTFGSACGDYVQMCSIV